MKWLFCPPCYFHLVHHQPPSQFSTYHHQPGSVSVNKLWKCVNLSETITYIEKEKMGIWVNPPQVLCIQFPKHENLSANQKYLSEQHREERHRRVRNNLPPKRRNHCDGLGQSNFWLYGCTVFIIMRFHCYIYEIIFLLDLSYHIFLFAHHLRLTS